MLEKEGNGWARGAEDVSEGRKNDGAVAGRGGWLALTHKHVWLKVSSVTLDCVR